MSLAAQAVQQAIFELLLADPDLAAMVDPAAIADHPHPAAALPNVLIGPIDSGDFSTFTEDGEEHLFGLEVWSDAPGHQQAETIAARLRTLLHHAPLLLESFQLVDLAWLSTRTRHDAKSGAHIAEMRFRAVTE